VVGWCDAEDVGARDRVDDLVAAREDDTDRDVLARRDAPGGVDAGPFVDDRDGVRTDGATDVRNSSSGGEPGVGGVNHEGVVLPADGDAGGVDLTCGEPRAVLDRTPEIRRSRKGSVDDDEQRLRALRGRRAAAGRQGENSSNQQEAPHGGPV
jgi:hypothetical protein